MIAGFDLARTLAPPAYQPTPGEMCEITLAGVDAPDGRPRWWRVMFASAALGMMHVAALEPNMPLGTVTGIRAIVEN